MGSARFAEFCRLPHRPATPVSQWARIRARPLHASGGMQPYGPKIRRVRDDNWKVYGVRKAWRPLCREGEVAVARTVACLMTGPGFRGIVWEKAIKTTIPGTSAPCPRDKVNRKFRAPAPNMYWGRPSLRHRFKPDERRLHLCLNLVGRCLRRRSLLGPSLLGLNQLRLQSLDNRHLRQPHRRLERVAICQDGLRPGCT